MEAIQVHSSWEARSLHEAFDSLRCATCLHPVENWICIMQKCRDDMNLTLAKRVHVHVHRNGLEALEVVGNHLIPMLVECGCISDAQQAFHRLTYPNEYAWTSLIQAFVNCGKCQYALTLFEEMQEDCVHPSRFTLQALLKACARLKYLEKGWQIHSEIFLAGYDLDPFVGNTLVDMYARCGSFEEAWEVFCTLPGRDVVTWNALLSGCTENMLFQEALSYWKEMRLTGLGPDGVTFVCILKACSSTKALETGREIHTEIVAEGLEKESFIGNSLVDMYVKCGSCTEALQVFNELVSRGVESWNTLITGFSGQGLGEEAVKCLDQMLLDGVAPSEVTFICSLNACGTSGILDRGRKLHSDVMKEGLEITLFLGNSLVDMYSKCGSFTDAQKVFDTLSVRDVVSFNALFAGYARHGKSEMLFSTMEIMTQKGVRPDWITYLSALSVCNHNGLVHDGQECFEMMIISHGIIPTIRHQSCIINLFGRAGQVDEGFNVLANFWSHSTLPTASDACQTMRDMHAGNDAFRWGTRFTENDATAIFLLYSFYADAHLGEVVEDLMQYFAKADMWKGHSINLQRNSGWG